ncbi:MAG: glutamate-1-semialdehyde 2,1-aminomutase [Kiritimatiellae bacterium]|nr:glutamate-1-semialdehyde 2,1-aminomutase [Kiritimatiellia bacterium]
MTAPLAERARAVLPGGVNSPVRAFRAVGGTPIFARRAEGAHLHTVDGRRLVDFCMSFGPLILGHARPEVVAAVAEAAARGTSFAVTTEAEVELAEEIVSAIPSVDRVRLVNSGTEACMTALRIARGATGRDRILKFSGAYHGHADGLLVRAGSGVAGLAEASSAGVPRAWAQQTLIARFNHIEDVDRVLTEHGRELAAIVLEPIPANAGLIPPEPGFLRAVADRAAAVGALLIWDEVITGFRFGWGSVQTLEPGAIRPDLICLGKIIGGGLPVGAVGGRAALMDLLAPDGPVYQAGTLSGNPISVAAGLATLRCLKAERPWPDLARRTAAYVAELRDLAAAAGAAVEFVVRGSLFSMFFGERAPRCFEEIPAEQAERFRPLFHTLLAGGVYLPPSAFEVAFLSTAHTDEVLESTLPVWRRALEMLAVDEPRGERAPKR